MKTVMNILVGILFSVNLFGQNNYFSSENKYRAFFKGGIEPSTVFSLGIEYKSNIELLGSPVGFYGQVTQLFFKPGFGNAEFKFGGLYHKSITGSFGIINSINVSTGAISTINFDSRKYAVAGAFEIGFYKPKWYVSVLTVEYEKILTSHIEHTDHFKTVFYEGAQDGWYKGPGGSWQFGLEWGKTFNQKFDLHIELKVPFTENFRAYAGSPYHLNLGLGYRF